MHQPRELLSMTVEDVLRHNPAAGAVLGGYSIDLCRCWRLSVEAAARTVGNDPHQVVAAVAAVQPAPPAKEAAALFSLL